MALIASQMEFLLLIRCWKNQIFRFGRIIAKTPRSRRTKQTVNRNVHRIQIDEIISFQRFLLLICIGFEVFIVNINMDSKTAQGTIRGISIASPLHVVVECKSNSSFYIIR